MKEFNYKSVSVRIDDSQEKETLYINGKEVPYRKSELGYAIYYQGSFDSLEKAVKDYIDNK